MKLRRYIAQDSNSTSHRRWAYAGLRTMKTALSVLISISLHRKPLAGYNLGWSMRLGYAPLNMHMSESMRENRQCECGCGTSVLERFVQGHNTRVRPIKKMPTKTCAQCGKLFHKRRSRGWQDWERMRFCSHICHHKSLFVDFNLSEADLAWLAGLLEGEGSFSLGKAGRSRFLSPRIDLGMTDEDVVARAAKLMGISNYHQVRGRKNGWKPFYRLVFAGERCARLMRLLLPYMGNRRSDRIRSILSTWSNRESELAQ